MTRKPKGLLSLGAHSFSSVFSDAPSYFSPLRRVTYVWVKYVSPCISKFMFCLQVRLYVYLLLYCLFVCVVYFSSEVGVCLFVCLFFNEVANIYEGEGEKGKKTLNNLVISKTNY